MPTLTLRASLAVLMLAAGFVSLHAGDPAKKDACPATADLKARCKALKGVVHLRDNDLRFARKGGGLVFVDPTSGPDDPLVVKSGLLKPDLILITHPHGDHFQPAVLQAYQKLNPQVVLAGPADVVKLAAEQGVAGMQVVAPNQSYTLAGFEFSTLPAYFTENGPQWAHRRESGWVGYVLVQNGARYYVTGDSAPVPEMANARADVIFPLLVGCGGNTEQALKMAELSGAKLVVPVHTGGRLETIKNYAARLPASVAAACYVDGQLTPLPPASPGT